MMIIIMTMAWVAKVPDCDIIEYDFESQSNYYVHFLTNTLVKGTNPLSLNYRLISTITVLLHGWLRH